MHCQDSVPTIQLLAKWIESDERHSAVEEESLLTAIGLRQDMNPQLLEIQYLPTNDGSIALQFQMQLVQLNGSEKAGEVTSFLFFLNRMADLPGFFLQELEDTVYYRYVWIGTQLDRPTLEVLVERCRGLFESYTGILEEICQGKISFHQAIAQI